MTVPVILYAPAGYWSASDIELALMTGGCGPGGLGDLLVPDTVWGLSIFPACRIHDYMYAMGETLADKEAADRAFLNNMIRIIQAKTKSRILRSLRALRAHTYYEAVHRFGGPVFWAFKNGDGEERTVHI